MEAIFGGITAIFSDPMCLALLVFGVFLGIVFGCIPGLTATLGVTLMIPFTYGLTAVQGLTLLIAIYVGGISGGLITATLINIPGTPSSIFTCYDAVSYTHLDVYKRQFHRLSAWLWKEILMPAENR